MSKGSRSCVGSLLNDFDGQYRTDPIGFHNKRNVVVTFRMVSDGTVMEHM